MAQNPYQMPDNGGRQINNPQHPQQPYQHGAPMGFSQAPKRMSSMAIAGLVLGIIALLTSFLPIVNNLSFIIGLLGAVFAIVGIVGAVRGKCRGKGLAIAALVVSVVSLVVVLATQSMYSAAIDQATEQISSGAPTQTSSADAAAGDASEAGGASEASDPYKVEGEALDGDEYSSTITGVFTNTSSNTMSYVQLSYNLFDADGAQIGTAYANTNNVAAGGTWKFEAFSTTAADEVDSYKLVDVTTF